MRRGIFFVLLALSTFNFQFSTAQCTFLGIDCRQWRDWNGWSDDDGRYKHHFSSLEIGFNGLRDLGGYYNWGPIPTVYPAPSTDPDHFMELNMARSMSWTFNLVGFGTRISRDNTLGLAGSIGLAVNDYAFREPLRMGVAGEQIMPVERDERLKKSKLNTVAIHVPVVLELNTGRQSFIAAGAYADLLIGSHFKSKFPKEKLRRTYTDFAQVGLTARAGWRDFYVYGNYGLTDLIDRSHGPVVRPFSFGIGVGF